MEELKDIKPYMYSSETLYWSSLVVGILIIISVLIMVGLIIKNG